MNSRFLPIGIAALSFLGFADAAYLTAEHYLKLPLPCSLTQGCDTVLTSAYATFGGIPIALFGALYYLILIVFALMLLTSETQNKKIMRLIFVMTAAAVLASSVLVYLQFFVIHALCMYCLVSAGLSLLLFLVSIALIVKHT